MHWYPIGGKRGNAGQIALAKRPINPLAERLVNAMEAVIEMHRQRELKDQPLALPPGSPRLAVIVVQIGTWFCAQPFGQSIVVSDGMNRFRISSSMKQAPFACSPSKWGGENRIDKIA